MKKFTDLLQLSMSSHVTFSGKEIVKQTKSQKKGLIWRLVQGSFWNRVKHRYMNFTIDPSMSLNPGWKAHNILFPFQKMILTLAGIFFLLTAYRLSGSPQYDPLSSEDTEFLSQQKKIKSEATLRGLWYIVYSFRLQYLRIARRTAYSFARKSQFCFNKTEHTVVFLCFFLYGCNETTN